MTEETYRKLVDELYERDLKQRMIDHLNRIGIILTEGGFKCSRPYDMTDVTFRWSIIAERADIPEHVDISIEISESLEYGDGTQGVNISLGIVGEGGRIIGDLTPGNYTPDVWVDLQNPEEIEYRMRIHEESDIGDIPALIEDAYR